MSGRGVGLFVCECIAYNKNKTTKKLCYRSSSMKTRTFRAAPMSALVTVLTCTLISVAVTLFRLKVETG